MGGVCWVPQLLWWYKWKELISDSIILVLLSRMFYFDKDFQVLKGSFMSVVGCSSTVNCFQTLFLDRCRNDSQVTLKLKS